MDAISTDSMTTWLALARPPFHIVGVLPFALGTLLAWNLAGEFDASILALGATGVVLVMLSAYLSGEYWDQEEDAISHAKGASRFSGGSGKIPAGEVEERPVLYASITCVFGACAVGMVLWLWIGTGPLTLPLGLMGLIGGFFYSTRPVRWVSRGLGEMWIAFCYGWLPVATGYYLQTGEIPLILHWISIPIGITIFNVILLNEFPDHEADIVSGKHNMVARMGRKSGSRLYMVLSFASIAAFSAWGLESGAFTSLLAYLPVAVLSVLLVTLIRDARWWIEPKIETLCGLNILVNIGTTGAYMIGSLV